MREQLPPRASGQLSQLTPTHEIRRLQPTLDRQRVELPLPKPPPPTALSPTPAHPLFPRRQGLRRFPKRDLGPQGAPPATPRRRLPSAQAPTQRSHVPTVRATGPKHVAMLRTVGEKRQRPLRAQVRRFSSLRLLAQAMDAVARQDLRLRNKPVLGVVKEVGLVIEPPEFQRPKAPPEVKAGNPRRG